MVSESTCHTHCHCLSSWGILLPKMCSTGPGNAPLDATGNRNSSFGTYLKTALLASNYTGVTGTTVFDQVAMQEFLGREGL